MKHFTKDKPQFEHDCNCSAFLGRHVSKGKNYDLYYCGEDIDGPTIIGRWGKDGNYCSKIIGARHCDFNYITDSNKHNYSLGNNRIYTEIVDRALKFGLITNKEAR